MTSNITYICAFYYIPENKKNNLEHYKTHIPKYQIHLVI